MQVDLKEQRNEALQRPVQLSDDKVKDELIDCRFLFLVNLKRHLLYGSVYTSMLRKVK